MSGRLWMRTRIFQSSLPVFGKVRVHPLFLALLFGAWTVGLLPMAIVLFMVVILHELGHAVVANALGYEVERVSLLPFGGVASLAYTNMGFRPRDEALVAVAGPVVNLVLACLAFAMHAAGLWSLAFFRQVVEINVWIAMFNLLPALPLDGGRILRAARARRVGYELATREAYKVAIVLAVTLLLVGVIALSAGHAHMGMLVVGLFLLVSVWQGWRSLRVETMRFLDAKRHQTITKPQRVRSLATHPDATLRDVAMQFAPDRYHLVYVVDDAGAVQALVEEPEILNAVFAGRWLDKVKSLTL